MALRTLILSRKPKTCKIIWLVVKFAIPLHRFLGDSLAQQVEHIPFKDGVVGSSPTRITIGTQPLERLRLLFYTWNPSVEKYEGLWRMPGSFVIMFC